MFSIMIGIITVIVLPTSEDAPMRHFNLHSFFNFTAIVLAKLFNRYLNNSIIIGIINNY